MQEQRENILIERLKETIRIHHHSTEGSSRHRHIASPPVTTEEIAQAEMQLAFRLPLFLKRLYLEVGNGGFGPEYGFFPLNNHETSTNSLVSAYLDMRSMSQKDIDEHWADKEEKPALWPERMLMVCDWGCNIYSCLNCTSPDLPIYRMDSNRNFLVEWATEAPSLQQWLEACVEENHFFIWIGSKQAKYPSLISERLSNTSSNQRVSVSNFCCGSISSVAKYQPYKAFPLSSETSAAELNKCDSSESDASTPTKNFWAGKPNYFPALFSYQS